MYELEYGNALKLGQKEKRRLISSGKYPYLPALDELIEEELIETGKNIGLVDIPTEFIVGTKTRGRANMFAGNYMPLADEHTEFASKWERLCTAHQEEGIREPIIVYEYLNRFYVLEGNKRVSVLKYFGAVTISGQVRRIMPVKKDSIEAVCYEEFLKFYKQTRVNGIEFSKPERYGKFLKVIGVTEERSLTENEIRTLNSAYYYFRQVYEKAMKNGLECTVGDAFLQYLSIYGYENFKEKSRDTIKKELQSIREELELLQEERSIDLNLEPQKLEKPLLKKIFSNEKNVSKVAFIYDKTPEESVWTYGHEEGRQYIEKKFQGKLETRVYENGTKEPEAILETAIQEGCNVIFATSPELLKASLVAAVKHPKVMILNCSLNHSHRYIRTYYARMYEVKFLCGVIAGCLTENHKIGYLCDYPVPVQIAGINAFALGVQLVNPNAEVYLEWSCVDGVRSALGRLRERGISLISSQDLDKKNKDVYSPFGLFHHTQEGQDILALPVWHWGIYYEKLLDSIMNQTFQMEYESTHKALNYYWGISAGVVELVCSSRLPESTKRLFKLLEQLICDGGYEPFSGPFETQAGEIIDENGEGISVENIIAMDWLLKNVKGIIPEDEKLKMNGEEE